MSESVVYGVLLCGPMVTGLGVAAFWLQGGKRAVDEKDIAGRASGHGSSRRRRVLSILAAR